MVILRAGLYIAGAIAVLATWQSSSVGYPIEVAMARGLLAFMAASLVAYVAELVVLTAPPSTHSRTREDEFLGGDEHDEAGAPVSLPAIRTERDAALDDSRAA